MATRTRRNTIRIIEDPVVDHIVHEWLSAGSDTELGRFLGELSGDVFNGRRQLLQYIKNPGLKDVQYFSLRQVNTNKNKIIYVGISTKHLD